MLEVNLLNFAAAMAIVQIDDCHYF